MPNTNSIRAAVQGLSAPSIAAEQIERDQVDLASLLMPLPPFSIFTHQDARADLAFLEAGRALAAPPISPELSRDIHANAEGRAVEARAALIGRGFSLEQSYVVEASIRHFAASHIVEKAEPGMEPSPEDLEQEIDELVEALSDDEKAEIHERIMEALDISEEQEERLLAGVARGVTEREKHALADRYAIQLTDALPYDAREELLEALEPARDSLRRTPIRRQPRAGRFDGDPSFDEAPTDAEIGALERMRQAWARAA